MSATWCWPQELKHPLTLMCRFLIASSSEALCSAKRVRNPPARPRRRGNTQLAGIRAGAGGDIDVGRSSPGPRIAKTQVLQLLIESRELVVAHPSEHDVLLDGCAGVIGSILLDNVGQFPRLLR